jgi:uncharacterized membrane protein YhfC
MHIPILSIIFIFISAAVQIGTPIFLFLYFRKKFDAKVIPMIFGVLGFVIFVLVLEGSIHGIVINNFSLREKPAIYIIYGIFMAGIFEETARFIAFNILKKKYSGTGTALAYGIGHGGTESVLLAGITMLAVGIISIIINTGNAGIITGKLQGDALAAMNSQIDSLSASAPYMFLISGFERLMAIAIQLSLSIIVFYSVYNKKLYLFPLAILIHAIIDFSAAAFQVGVIKNVFLVEGIVLACAIATALLAKYIHDREKTAILAAESTTPP